MMVVQLLLLKVLTLRLLLVTREDPSSTGLPRDEVGSVYCPMSLSLRFPLRSDRSKLPLVGEIWVECRVAGVRGRLYRYAERVYLFVDFGDFGDGFDVSLLRIDVAGPPKHHNR
jgi:hypothetical protein